MRKRFLFLPLLMVLGINAVAQPIFTAKNNFSKHTIAALKKSNSQSKGTGAMQRISATSTYSIDMSGGGLPSLELNDSTKYKYSNGRAGSFDPAQMNDLDNDMSEFISFDSSWNYTDNGSGLALSELTAVSYNTGNKRNSVTGYTANGSSTLSADKDIRYEYNTDGNVSVKHELSWNKGKNSWDSVMRTYYDYNAQKKLEQERVYNTAKKAWDTRMAYHYNASGDIDTVLTEDYTTTWSPSSREIHVFSSGKLSTSLTQSFTGATWMNEQIDTFGYTTGASFYTYSETKTWDAAKLVWVKSSQEIRTLNTQKLMDVHTMKTWDTAAKKWETDADLKWAYDSNKNPIRMEMTSPMLPLPIPVTRVNIYYETYFPTTVAQINRSTPVTVYPNPATDKVTISFENDKTSAVVGITNIAGQIISHSHLTANNGAIELSLQGLQPGAYNVSLQFSDGSFSSQRIIKQ